MAAAAIGALSLAESYLASEARDGGWEDAPSSEASRLGVRFWDLLDGGGMRWETCGLLQHCCQSFPPSLRIFRIQVDFFSCSE